MIKQNDNQNIALTDISIHAAKGSVAANSITGVLIHEHVFNKFPFRLREKSEQFAIEELNNAYNSGINLIVDLTPYTNVYDYYRVIDGTPMNILTCTGFYTSGYMSPKIKRMTEDELFASLSKKIELGVGVRKIKPSILKAAVQKDKINEIEHRFLRVIGRLNRKYSLPVVLHTPFSTLNNAMQLLEYGVEPSQLMVAHIENGISKEDELKARTRAAKQLAELGCYIQLADFGSNKTTAKCKSTLILFDSLLDSGYVNNLLISSDSNWRWRSAKPVLRNANNDGGRRYTYTLTHTLPLIQEHTGTDMCELFLHQNPLKYLMLPSK